MRTASTSAILVSLRAALERGATYSSIAHDAGLDRRTISRLDAGEDVELRVSQIEALHVVFAKLGLPLLRHPTMAAALAAGGDVQLLIPAYRDSANKHRRLCSPWDVLAADRIRGPLQQKYPTIRTTLQQVAHEEPLKLEQDVTQRSGHILCIGSPRATAAFDSVASRITEFGSGRDERHVRPPVRFYWKDFHSDSPFVMTDDELPRRLRKDANLRAARAALIFDDDDPLGKDLPPLVEITNLDDPTRRSFDSYAMVLARRMENGGIWACISGLTGPATEAAARLFLDLEFSVPPLPTQADSSSRGHTSAHGESTFAALALYLIRATIDVNSDDAYADDLRTIRGDSIELLSTPWPQPRYLMP